MSQCYNVTLQCHNVTMFKQCHATLHPINILTHKLYNIYCTSCAVKSDSTAWRGCTFGGGTTCGGVQYMWGVYMVEGLYNMWGVTVGGFYPKFRSWFHFKLKFHTLLLISQMRPWYRPAMGVFVIRPSTKNTASCLLLSEKNKDKLASVGNPKKSMDVAVFPPLKLHHMCCFVSSPTDIRVCTIR